MEWSTVFSFFIFFLRLTVHFHRCFLQYQSLSCPSLILSRLYRCLTLFTTRSICAARMYRSLCEQGNLTEYATYVLRSILRSFSLILRSSDPPHLPFPNRHHYHSRELNSSPLHFHHVRTTSGVSFPETERGGGMVAEPFVLVPTAAELMQQAVSASAASFSNTTIAVPAKSKSRDGYRLSWHRPVDPTARSFD